VQNYVLLKQPENRIYLGGNIEFWKALPVLFPIVGTLKNNIYQYKDTTYHLPRHGFARDIIFELIDKKEYSHFCNSIIGCDKKTVPF
jgi:galactose mutarotase-like enzyme